MHRLRNGVAVLLTIFLWQPLHAEETAVHMGNGIKVGEVTSDSAIVWTRLTQAPERNINGRPWKSNVKRDDPVIALAHPIGEMQGSLVGAAGEVQLSYWPEGKKDAQPRTTGWKAVNPGRDFIHQFQIAVRRHVRF